jgi:hypothetical protein
MDFDPYLEPDRYDTLWRFLVNGPEAVTVNRWLQRLYGQTVIDLGSGMDSHRFQEFLYSFGAEYYLPVDIKQGHDMLGLMRHLYPERPVSFSLNGINEELLAAESDYVQELIIEIERNLSPKGLVLGVGAGGALKALSDRPGFINQFLPLEDPFGNPDYGFYFIAKEK